VLQDVRSIAKLAVKSSSQEHDQVITGGREYAAATATEMWLLITRC